MHNLYSLAGSPNPLTTTNMIYVAPQSWIRSSWHPLLR